MLWIVAVVSLLRSILFSCLSSSFITVVIQLCLRCKCISLFCRHIAANVYSICVKCMWRQVHCIDVHTAINSSSCPTCLCTEIRFFSTYCADFGPVYWFVASCNCVAVSLRFSRIHLHLAILFLLIFQNICTHFVSCLFLLYVVFMWNWSEQLHLHEVCVLTSVRFFSSLTQTA